MKFKYIPNIYIIDYDKMIEICKFDENGYFETDDPKKIEYLTKKATSVQIVEEQQKRKKQQGMNEQKEQKEEKQYKCKQCDFVTDNKGELLAHYRISHKK